FRPRNRRESPRCWCEPEKAPSPKRRLPVPACLFSTTSAHSPRRCCPIRSPSQGRNPVNILSTFDEHNAVMRDVARLAPLLEQAVAVMQACLASGQKILVCGNGGSAA